MSHISNYSKEAITTKIPRFHYLKDHFQTDYGNITEIRYRIKFNRLHYFYLVPVFSTVVPFLGAPFVYDDLMNDGWETHYFDKDDGSHLSTSKSEAIAIKSTKDENKRREQAEQERAEEEQEEANLLASLLIQGDELLATEDYEGAFTLYETILNHDPNHSEAVDKHCLSTNLRDGFQFLNQANTLFEQAIESNRNQDYCKSKELYLQAEVQFKEALIHFNKAAAKNNRFQVNCASLRSQLKEIKDAVHSLNEAILLNEFEEGLHSELENGVEVTAPIVINRTQGLVDINRH